MEQRIKIKHPGARGWAGIVASAFDPAKHEMFGAPEKRSAVPTREGISTMGKADLIEWLDAHEVEFDRRQGVPKLRDLLTRVMFVDL